jgi:hypothetical protein
MQRQRTLPKCNLKFLLLLYKTGGKWFNGRSADARLGEGRIHADLKKQHAEP